jgi:hypothetical protein
MHSWGAERKEKAPFLLSINKEIAPLIKLSSLRQARWDGEDISFN